MLGQHLDGDVPVESWVMRRVDDAHAALAELADDRVRTELRAGRQGHGAPSIARQVNRQTREFSTGDFRFFTFALGCSTVQLACGKVG